MGGLNDRAIEDGAAITSPCTGVCVIDEASGWCEGCGRTLDEIAMWGNATDAERQAVLERINSSPVRGGGPRPQGVVEGERLKRPARG